MNPSSSSPAPQLAGMYVTVIQIRGNHVEPRYRRRVMFNLPAAQRAVDKARKAGLDASVILCTLVPVTEVLDD